MFTTRLTKAIGGNSDLNTSQSFIFQGATIESEQVILLVLLSASGEDIFTKIRNIGFSIEQYFFSSELPLTEKLQKTMDYLLEQTAGIEHKNILLAALKDEALYMLSAGTDQVLLNRDQKTISLVTQGDSQLISGFLQPGDKALFISPRFAREDDPVPIWDEYFIQRMLLSDQEVAEIEIENYLQQLDKPEPIAVIVLSTKAVEPTTIQAPAKEDAFMQVHSTDPEKQGDDDEIIHQMQPDLKHEGERKKSRIRFRLPTIPPKLKRALFKLVFPVTFKKLGIIAIIIIIIASISAISLYQIQQKIEKQNQLSTAINTTRQNIASADQQKESNREGAKQSLQNAQKALKNASLIDPDNTEVKELKPQLAQVESVIYRSTPITNWQTFLSLDLVRPGFSSKRMSYSVGKILLLDESQKSLFQIEIKTKNNQLIAGQTQLGDAQYASLNGDFAFVYSRDKGLLRIETPKRQITTVATVDTEWGEITDIFGFSSNVYLLDAKNNQIWKYVPAGSGYTEKQIYLKDNQGLDFTNAKQLYIDFSVWVLRDLPEIIRFTAGTRDFYSIGGLDTPLNQVEAIFAPEKEDLLFILDPQNKRVLMTKKNGEYISQYTSDIFAAATDLIYDEESKTLYVLEDSKIHQTTL